MPHSKIVSRITKIPGIGVDQAANMADAAHDPNILRLENLDTDILPPQVAIEATRNAIGNDLNNSYLPFLGQNNLRQCVAQRINRTSGIHYDWQTQAIISAGGMSGILNCLLALIEEGDEVIVTDPTYAGIINRIYLAGGIPKFAPLIPASTGWSLNIAALNSLASPRTRMVIISPGMPTGHVLTTAEWQAITTFCIKQDCWLLYDAAMERILYDNRIVIHPASFPGMHDRTITVGSASKEFRMIGWRVGWIVAPKPALHDIGLVSMANVVCQVGIGMPGVTAALNAQDDGLEAAIKVWQARRDTLLNELDGLPIIPPHGGWSLLLDAEQLGFSAPNLAAKLFKEAKIATTPMTGWGEHAGRYIRLVFSNEPAERLIGIGAKIKTII